MTQIHISIRKPKTGGLDPVTGTLRFRPVRRHFDAAKNLVIAASFDADLSEDGELTVDLLPTTPAFVWQVVELADSQAYTRYVEVPDSKSVVEYSDLDDVDPATFQPVAVAGSPLVNWMIVGSQTEAEAQSEAYQTRLVIYPVDATESRAREIMDSLEQLQADAATAAARTRAVKSQAVQDAGMVAAAANGLAAVSIAADTARESIQAKSDEASVDIDGIVQSVREKANTGIADIQQAEDSVKDDSTVHDGSESGIQTGDGSTTNVKDEAAGDTPVEE